MEDTTTTIALLQQSLTSIEKTLVRLEQKLDKFEEASRTFMPRSEMKEEFALYTTREQHDSLKDKVSAVYKVMWTIGSAVIALAIQAIWELMKGGK